MDLLIPYRPLYDHEDPMFDEFTYGDVEARARKLRELKEGDYIFFHTSVGGKKYITAYYVVNRVLDTADATKNRSIVLKYKNPHIMEYLQGERRGYDDVIVFGDPILSRKLERPLPFDRNLAGKLSLAIKFKKGFTETQCIGSATRQWRELTKRDVRVLLKEIKRNERKGFFHPTLLSTDEVTEIIERDIENFIERNPLVVGKSLPLVVGKSLKLVRRQYDTPVGRIDMLFEDKRGKKIIVELKLNKIGRDAVNQIRRYMSYVRKETKKEVNGVIICKGIMPAFEKELKKLKKIKILKYGWNLKIAPVR